MIPLHIADQAVAACDAEIQKLREENARLKAEVERLTADLPKMVAWGRGLEHDKRLLQEDYARLRAEVERLTEAGDDLAMMVGHIEVKGDAHRMMLEFSNEWNAAKEGKTK